MSSKLPKLWASLTACQLPDFYEMKPVIFPSFGFASEKFENGENMLISTLVVLKMRFCSCVGHPLSMENADLRRTLLMQEKICNYLIIQSVKAFFTRVFNLAK